MAVNTVDMIDTDGDVVKVQSVDVQNALLNGMAYPSGGFTPYIMKEASVRTPEVFPRYKKVLNDTEKAAAEAAGWVLASPALTGAQGTAGCLNDTN